VATGLGTDIPIGMVIRTTAIKSTGDQPVFQRSIRNLEL
jgi:hypothetical protein